MSHILEFLDLVDVPNTYSGADNYRLKIDGTSVEFVDDAFLSLNDTPSTFSGFPDYYLKVNAGATAVEFQSAANLETALGGPFLPLSAGSGEALTDALYIDKTASPGIFLRETGSATDYTYLADTGALGKFKKVAVTGNATLWFDAAPSDGTSASKINFGRGTTTSGAFSIRVFEGDGTDVVNHALFGASGDADLCIIGGSVSEGGNDVLTEGANEITAITPKTTLVDADEFILEDSGASFVKKAVTAANIAVYVETDLGGPWLPLTAGSGEPLTGNFYIETATVPSLYLAAGGSGTSFSRFYDSGTLLSISKTSATHALIYFDPDCGSTSEAVINFFEGTTTSGDVKFQIYNGTGSIQHTIYGAGNVELCKLGGNVNIDEGGLYLNKTNNPAIYIGEGGTTNSDLRLWDDAGGGYIRKVEITGSATLYLDPYAVDGTSSSRINLFLATNTSGTADLRLFVGDGTATVQHQFDVGTGNVTLCQQAGNVTIEEGNLYIDKTADPSIYLREAASATSYTRLYDSTAAIGSLDKVVTTGGAYLELNPIAIDGTSHCYIRLFRDTNTTGGDTSLVLYAADGTSTAVHKFEADGNAQMCITGGNLELEEGNLYLNKTSNPTILLRENDDASNYGYIEGTDSAQIRLCHTTLAGASYVVFEPFVTNGTSTSEVRMFRSTNTSGIAHLVLYQADNTATIQHVFRADNGDVTLCQQAGFLSVAGNDVLTEGAAEISDLTAKTTPVDADIVVIEDSAASWAKKKVTLENIAGSAIKSIFDAYQSTGGTVLGLTLVDIPWQTERKKDTEFIHSASSAEIEFDFSGDVLITADFTAVNAHAANRYQADYVALLDGGGGYALIAGSETHSYHRVLNTGTSTASMRFFYNVTAGDKIKFQGKSGTATDVTTVAHASRVTIEKLSVTVPADIDSDAKTVLWVGANQIVTVDVWRLLYTSTQRYRKTTIEVNYAGRAWGNGWWGKIVFENQLAQTPTYHITYEKHLTDSDSTQDTYGEISIRELAAGAGFEIWCKAKESHGIIGFCAETNYHWGGNPFPIQAFEGAITGTAPTSGSEIFNSSTTTPDILYDNYGSTKAIEVDGTALAASTVPATTDVVYADTGLSTAAYTWRTLFDVTSFSGDIMTLYWLMNDGGSDDWYFKVTCDGTVVYDETTLVNPGDVGIGPTAVTACIFPFFATTSMKLEIYNTNAASKVLYWRYQYMLLTNS